eukprot:GHVN01075591.1.p1 GENE.GHVN01075591.1~~GHVN01075591.1.p1  ORF type:complete len:346 (+),score=49.35 GHVN01075591.1:79-1116(+)
MFFGRPLISLTHSPLFFVSLVNYQRGLALSSSSYRYVASDTCPSRFMHTGMSSTSTPLNFGSVDGVHVHAVPLFTDNYSYFIHADGSPDTYVVDPADPSRIESAMKEMSETNGLKLKGILTTHSHWDHAGGNKKLLEDHPELKVYGLVFSGSGEEMTLTDNFEAAGLTKPWGEVTKTLGDLTITVISAPCHTKSHVLYRIVNNKKPNGRATLFTGDTLFIAGCGRFFSGTGSDMYKNMGLISKMNDDTVLFVGHEYTEANLVFSHAIEPSNGSVKDKLTEVREKKGLPSIPSSIAQEKAINPFMRCDIYSKNPTLLQSIRLSADPTPVDVMTALREAKNNYKANV